MLKILAQILCLSVIFSSVLAEENLDEVEARASRKSNNTFYSGESVGNSYLWQPQTLCYTDITSGHQIWVMTCTDDETSFTGREFGHQPWSADGKRIALALDKDTIAFTRGVYASNENWFTAHSDGASMRPRVNSKARMRVHNAYTHWSPTIPDVYYIFGRNYADEGGSAGHLYKETVSDTSVSSTDWITFAATERALTKDTISSDGKYIIATELDGSTSVSVGNVITQTLTAVLTDYDMDLGGLDTNWGDTPASFTGWHDEMFVNDGVDGYWIYFLPDSSHIWWRMRPWGTDNNAPTETRDTSSPYDWWTGTDAQKEVQPLNCPISEGTQPFALNYWSHAVPDRWGNHIAYSDVDGAYVAPGVCNTTSMTRIAFPVSVKGSQYHAWTGWTDYSMGTDGPNQIYIMEFDNAASHIEIAATHVTTGTMFTKPGQSPDGTKLAYRSNFLQPTTTNGDVFYVSTYYPYPPEIISCNATGGTVTSLFDWRQDQASPRTYTVRGWPNEDTDDPCPPRETEKFRLWRSDDNATWSPIDTVNAEIFTRYDFSDGTWDGAGNWTITDTPGDGTWYYGVTSEEWSGLESHCLSNIFSITVSSGSGTGAEHIVYPASPGDLDNISASDFYTSYSSGNTDLVRYYNIYAEDGSSPSISQTNRIASVPEAHCSGGDCSWVDWLGTTNGTTEYVVTAMDTQGNESSSLSCTATHQKSPANEVGQYTIEWDEVGGGSSSSSVTFSGMTPVGMTYP